MSLRYFKVEKREMLERVVKIPAQCTLYPFSIVRGKVGIGSKHS